MKNKAIFLDRDGVVNVERSYISRVEDMELYPFTGKAVKKINESAYMAIVITNQSAIAQNKLSFEKLEAIHRKMIDDLAAEGAKIDDIFFCPHYPVMKSADFNVSLVKECDCRKPKPGMFFQAAEKHNIDLTKSWMIGDSERDIIAAKAAGCKTIGVKTGHGLNNAKILPDFMVEGLEEALNKCLK